MGIDGNHILYHYLQKQLRENDIWLFQMLVARLIGSLGIWFSPSLYARLPVLLPHVIRDSTCRPRRRGAPDEWGAPDAEGYCRDDNSLVKALPRALSITSRSNSLYDGERLGNGFVASHVWRSVDTGTPGAKEGWTNTFIPNLVWLPTQLAKLTDRAGSFAQTYLQTLSYKLYRQAQVPAVLQSVTEAAWGHLPQSDRIPELGLPRTEDVSFFHETDQFVKRRRGVIRQTRDGLATLEDKVLGTLRPSRYAGGLGDLEIDQVAPLCRRLSAYLETCAA